MNKLKSWVSRGGGEAIGKKLGDNDFRFMDSMKHKIIVVDSDRNIVFANKSMRGGFERRKSLKGLKCHSLVYGTEKPSVHCAGCSVYGGGASGCSSLFDLNHSCGETVCVRPMPAMMAEDGIHHLICVFNSTNKELESLKCFNDIQKLHVRGVIHDLNNLLLWIKGSMEMAVKPGLMGSQVEECVKDCLNASTSSIRLLEDLSCRMKENDALIKNSSFGKINILDLMDRSAKLVLQGSNIRYMSHSRCSGGYVKGNALQMERLACNLLLNSKEALSGIEGGVIGVELSDTVLEEVNSLGLKSGKYIQINVTDNSNGIIGGVDLEKVFDPYYTTKKKGSGLGLAICSWIVRNHSGSIRAGSNNGSGSVFTVCLPRCGVAV